MAMQDKDFDKLFNQKFEDFEVEPSIACWNNIEAELDGKKATRSIIPWISIAAAILVIATAGVLFLKGDTQTGHDNKNNKLVLNPIKPVAPVKVEVEEANQAQTVVTARPATVRTTLAIRHQVSRMAPGAKSIIPVAVTPADIIEHDPSINEQAIIASVPNPASTKPAAILPDVQLTPRIIQDEGSNPALITANSSTERQDIEPVKRRGLHSFGGLINAVVAKLDKRDDKFIEFSDGDDGDDNATKVTGVNLGVIKIKKQ